MDAMMMSRRGKRALNALKSESMPIVIDMVIRAHNADIANSFIVDPFGFADTTVKTMSFLKALRDSYADALLIVMYAGRNEFKAGHPYDEADIDTQFSTWWSFIGCGMDKEHRVREILCSKSPLDEYLKMGQYMFRIGTEADRAVGFYGRAD